MFGIIFFEIVSINLDVTKIVSEFYASMNNFLWILKSIPSVVHDTPVPLTPNLA